MKYKNIKVKLNTRFILCIDEDFEYVYLKDLSTNERIGPLGCSNILEESIEEVKIISGLIENKISEKERMKNKEKTFKNLKVVK